MTNEPKQNAATGAHESTPRAIEPRALESLGADDVTPTDAERVRGGFSWSESQTGTHARSR